MSIIELVNRNVCINRFVVLFFSVVVSGGPNADGQELCFDQSPRLVFPPLVILIFYTCQLIDSVTQTWLDYLDVENQRQAWVFRRED